MCSTEDGFVIAEEDLKLRGPGEIFGTRQHGAPQMPALMLSGDARLVARAREAFLEVSRDPAYEAEREVLVKAGAEKYARSGRTFARN